MCAPLWKTGERWRVDQVVDEWKTEALQEAWREQGLEGSLQKILMHVWGQEITLTDCLDGAITDQS